MEDAAGNADALVRAYDAANEVYERCLQNFARSVHDSKWDGHGPGEISSVRLCSDGSKWINRAAYMRSAMNIASADKNFPAENISKGKSGE